jgi:hypothetical protein
MLTNMAQTWDSLAVNPKEHPQQKRDGSIPIDELNASNDD